MIPKRREKHADAFPADLLASRYERSERRLCLAEEFWLARRQSSVASAQPGVISGKKEDNYFNCPVFHVTV
jgi:hypothetical protein